MRSEDAGPDYVEACEPGRQFAFYSQGIGKPLGGFELTCVFIQSLWLAAMCATDSGTTEGKSGVVSHTLQDTVVIWLKIMEVVRAGF